jgi:hypothetical protein
MDRQEGERQEREESRNKHSLLSAQRGVASNRILGGHTAVSVVCFVVGLWRDVDVASGS